MKYNFVPVFDTKMKKRRSIAPHLAKDANYLLKMGFDLIEGPPEVLGLPTSENTIKVFHHPVEDKIPDYATGFGVKEGEVIKEVEDKDKVVELGYRNISPVELVEESVTQEKPKRGRPKKQS